MWNNHLADYSYARRDVEKLRTVVSWGCLGQGKHNETLSSDPRRHWSQPHRMFSQSWRWDTIVYAYAKRLQFQPGLGEPITLFLSQVQEGQCDGRATEHDSHPLSPHSHPCLLRTHPNHPSRATLKRRSPYSHPGDTHYPLCLSHTPAG